MKNQRKLTDQAWLRSLHAMHRDGKHVGEDEVVDPTGYWREQGCRACAAAYATLLPRAEDFEVVDRRETGPVTTWSLREVDSKALWVAVIFTDPAHDHVVAPDGQILNAGYSGDGYAANVPAGLWYLLSREYTT